MGEPWIVWSNSYKCMRCIVKEKTGWKQKHPNWKIARQTPSINLSAFYQGTNWPTHLIRGNKTAKYISQQLDVFFSNQITKLIKKSNLNKYISKFLHFEVPKLHSKCCALQSCWMYFLSEFPEVLEFQQYPLSPTRGFLRTAVKLLSLPWYRLTLTAIRWENNQKYCTAPIFNNWYLSFWSESRCRNLGIPRHHYRGIDHFYLGCQGFKLSSGKIVKMAFNRTTGRSVNL